MKYIVDVYEYERGWGNRWDSSKEFDSEEEAIKYVKEYNEKYNNKDIVPDWYMKAYYTKK